MMIEWGMYLKCGGMSVTASQQPCAWRDKKSPCARQDSSSELLSMELSPSLSLSERWDDCELEGLLRKDSSPSREESDMYSSP